MTLEEKMIIYEVVISTLRTQSDMVGTLSQLPIEQQLAGVKFMEFLGEEDDLVTDQSMVEPMFLDS